MELVKKALSSIYKKMVDLDREITVEKSLEKPVISVGNITWGGTGKTPIVMKIAEYLYKRSFKVAVLSRGYKRKSNGKESFIVCDGEAVLAEPQKSGDEPYLIAKNTNNTIVAVGVNRYESAMLVSKYRPDVFILDDGFQHWKIKRNLDIVCVNALNPFGNGNLIPFGSLREPLTSLSRADLILVTNSNLVDKSQVDSVCRKLREFSNVPIFESEYRVKSLSSIISNRNINPQQFINSQVIALSGIGESRGFIRTLENNKFNVVKHYKFSDHFWYGKNRIQEILSKEKYPVFTTEKDAVRLMNISKDIDRQLFSKIYVIKVDAEIREGEKFWETVLRRIQLSS